MSKKTDNKQQQRITENHTQFAKMALIGNEPINLCTATINQTTERTENGATKIESR